MGSGKAALKNRAAARRAALLAARRKKKDENKQKSDLQKRRDKANKKLSLIHI